LVGPTWRNVIVPDALADERHFSVDQQTGESALYLTVPLWVKQQVIGVLQVVDTRSIASAKWMSFCWVAGSHGCGK
jgi:hypothetical protein